MKSTVSVLLCLLIMFSLSACMAGKKQFVLKEGTDTVSFDLSGITVKGQLENNKDDITFTVTEPENLEGVTFSQNEIYKDEVKIKYSSVKEQSPVYMLLTAVKDISQKEILLPYKGSFTFESAVSSAGYKVNFDCENAVILSIETEKFIYIFE